MSSIPDILNAPWAITREKLEAIHSVYQVHLGTRETDLAQLYAAVTKAGAGKDDRRYAVVQGVAVIPVIGTIARRMNLFTHMSGGVSTELVARDLSEALDDPEVEAILLDVDSPGGSVGGLAPLADAIYQARGKKPVVAFAGDMMASAAYWIGSAADRVVAEPTSMVGSIGVITVHYDYSQADAKAGVKRTYIAAGAYKALGNDAEPLSPEATGHIQARLDYYYTLFVDTVARNRGTTRDTVLKDMADGRIFIGQQALDAGLIDTIGTREDAALLALSMVQTTKPSYFIVRR